MGGHGTGKWQARSRGGCGAVAKGQGQAVMVQRLTGSARACPTALPGKHPTSPVLRFATSPAESGCRGAAETEAAENVVIDVHAGNHHILALDSCATSPCCQGESMKRIGVSV